MRKPLHGFSVLELGALEDRVPPRPVVQPCQNVPSSVKPLVRHDVHGAVAVEIEGMSGLDTSAPSVLTL